VGEAAGCPDQARHYVAGLRARVDAVRTKTLDLPPDQRPRVAAIEWLDPMMIAGNWMPELIEIAGGIGGLATAGEQSRYVGWEDVLAYDPEVIVLLPCGFDLERTVEEANSLASLAAWRRITAANQRRVYAVDGNAYFNRSGPRMVDSLEILAYLIHPELFGAPQLPGATAARSRLASSS
jgi:iron complex transport system substrate-binding protein